MEQLPAHHINKQTLTATLFFIYYENGINIHLGQVLSLSNTAYNTWWQQCGVKLDSN